MEEDQSILYETLSPLGASEIVASSPPPPSPPSETDEPYVVLRSQILLSSVQCPSPATVAPEYFSLEVNDAETKETPPITPSPLSPPQPRKTANTEPERTLEGNWFRANCRFKSPMLQLHREIIDFCDFLSPTPEEQASRNAAIESVVAVINHIWPKAKAEVFGSFKTGLYLPSSDVDVVILHSEIKTPQMGLVALSRALSQKGIAKKMQVIAKARVPIIKFVEKKSGVSFDISFDVQNGPKAADFIIDAIYKWPPLRPLCLILKVFLQQRELNEVYTGGIGSYALLVMLIAMLQNQQHRQTSPEYNLGILLLLEQIDGSSGYWVVRFALMVNFFDIYGCKLNTTDVGVSCNGEGTFFVRSSRGFSVKGKTSIIAIEDPQAPENDIGKSSFNYFQVRSAFSRAFRALTNANDIIGLRPNRSILGTIIRPDAVLLERKGGSTGKVTFETLLPGAGEPLQQQFSNQQEIYCNWQLDNDEEPLPRRDGISEDRNVHSSGKKRKSPKEKKDRHGENGSRKERSGKKARWRHHQRGDDSNGYSRDHGGSSSLRHAS